MQLQPFIWAGALVVGWSLAASAATFEVAQRHPQASDTGPGTAEQPWKTIAKAAEQAGAGDRVLIRDGVYREMVVVRHSGTAQAPLRFEATPGAHVVVTGADLLSGWEKVAGERPIYRVAWPHRFNTWSRTMAHPDDEFHRLIGRCEQVAVEGYLLRQVLEAGQLAPGTFFADVEHQALLVWDRAGRDLNRVSVEASVRQQLWRMEGAWVEVRGLRFRYAANPAQQGAVILGGSHDTLEDCVLECMNSSGATFGAEDAVVRRCVLRDNGQLGFGAGSAHRLLFTDCLVENNNTKGFSRGWEAGGDKLVLCRDVVLERSRFVHNRGHGLWFDIGNEHCTVRHCLVADNEDSGIFYEISFGLQAHDNVIVGNGFAATPGAWGAQAGIALSSSPDCVLERNLLVGNREGFNFREQGRTTPRIGNPKEVPVWNHDEVIRHNILAYNRDAQVWGWFDVNDGRHWPAGRSGDKPATARPAGSADAYATSSGRGQASGLTLEQLRLKFESNVYFVAPGEGAFAWGVTWGRHKSYATLPDFQADLGIDTGGRVLEPAFADLRAGDYRLSSSAMAQVEGNYPQGEVPGVPLGVKR